MFLISRRGLILEYTEYEDEICKKYPEKNFLRLYSFKDGKIEIHYESLLPWNGNPELFRSFQEAFEGPTEEIRNNLELIVKGEFSSVAELVEA